MRLRRAAAALRVALMARLEPHMPNEAQHLFAVTLLTGVVCGLTAVGFHLFIRALEHLLIDRALHAQGNSWMAWTIISPTVGGLCAGALLTWVVPGARGSGIPQVKQAFAAEGGRVAFRDAVGKFFIGALNIGSGGSLGREGPTAQICAGATSLIARLTLLRPRSIRRLTPVGVAAGIAAAFNAPIAAVTFTIEEVVGTLDQAVLSGVVIAAALAAVIERGILGAHPVIEVDQSYALDHASSLVLYALLGVVAALTSAAFTDALLWLRLWFRRLRLVPTWMHPGVGGLVTGALAVLMLRFLGTGGVTGGGYEALGQALGGQLGLRVLLFLCVTKVVATVFSYSSGGAGGIFAPALFVGAMLGGAVGHLDVLIFEHGTRELGAFALVGMGAVFAGVIRAPMTSVLIIFEMTGGYGLVLPLMLANMISYLVARHLRPIPIYEALLAQDGIVLPHQSARRAPHPLEQMTVSDAMSRDVITVKDGLTIRDAVAAVAGCDFSVLPVLDARGGVLGAVDVSKLFNVTVDPEAAVATLMHDGHVIRQNTPLLQAILRMSELQVRQLFVIAGGADSRLVGVLATIDLVRAHAKAARVATTHDKLTHGLAAKEDVRASDLMVATTLVPASMRVSELATLLPAKALVVRGAEGELGVVLTKDLDDVADEALRRMLVAADLVRATPVVAEDADLPALMRAMGGENVEAAVVLDAGTREPIGVVTRVAVALAFFDQSVR